MIVNFIFFTINIFLLKKITLKIVRYLSVIYFCTKNKKIV